MPNIRYISGGKDAQLARSAIPIKFVTAERNAIPNAARNIPLPLGKNSKIPRWTIKYQITNHTIT
jgi:hypothetical protein